MHHIGISNCYDPKLFKTIYGQAHIKPSFLQNRFHADTGYDQELRKFCELNDIRYQSFWTLTANPYVLGSKQFTSLSKKYKRTSA